jgi:hypothetical protein
VRAVDVVAIILAVGLSALVVLILVATIVQIVGNTLVPEIQLSDNATQILVGALGAFTGLLGSYIGGRARRDP